MIPAGFVDSKRVLVHIDWLRVNGCGLHSIARAGNLSRMTVANVAHNRPKWVHRATAHKVMRVTVEDSLRARAAGTQRRLQALCWLGWSQAEIGRRIGMQKQTVSLITNSQQEYVMAETARRVAALYEELSMTYGDSKRTRDVALRKGWQPPLAWDDDEIDNPEAVAA